VTVGKIGQVLPYLLSAWLADMHLAADTPYSGNLASGKVVGEQLGRLMTLAVERWRRAWTQTMT
jgi:hypothetical protein